MRLPAQAGRTIVASLSVFNAVVCSRVRELQATLSAGTIELEIPAATRASRRCKKRWNCLRAGLDLILDQLGADMADIPGGVSGMPARDKQGQGKPTG